MWKPENCEQFSDIVRDLMQDEEVLAMENLPRHSKQSNCLNHSLMVAYLSFLVCKKLKWDHEAAARAGLLHDFTGGDWEEENQSILRLWQHPHQALKNAEERYALSGKEKDIIVKHMWPLTLRLPRHKESFVVSMADKACAFIEMCRLYHPKKARENLAAGLA